MRTRYHPVTAAPRVRNILRLRNTWPALLLLAPLLVLADEPSPRWELGLGLGVVTTPDYRGSDERRSYLLPVPYLIYRGDVLRVDRRGVRGKLIEAVRFSFHLSANLGPPADSDENEAREGMPDLHPTVEFGPALELRLHESEDGARRLALRMPLRAAVAVDFGEWETEYVGAVFLPHLELSLRRVGGSGWNLGLSAGPVFATDDYHDHYYSVRPEFVRLGRPAYDAPGGYSGVSFGLALTRRYPRYWVGAFLRYDNLSGAVFEDSPLVRTRHAILAGVGISRIVAESSRPAAGNAED